MRAADERSATRPRSPGDGPMKPLAALDPRLARAVLFDIDETLTTGGKLTALAYAALERLKGAGKLVVPVTGRPAAWCDHIPRMWPPTAVAPENGAFSFGFFDGALAGRFHDDPPPRPRNRARLQGIAERILAAVPGCALASDQAYRESALAIDYCEDVAPLPVETAERIASLMREAGLTAKISSIHVNGWFGDYDKLSMARALFPPAGALRLRN